MLEGAGFKVIDLGTDVTPQKFVEAIREHQPHILCLSALLTVTARPRYALFGTDGVVHAAIHINQLSLGCSRPRRRAGRPGILLGYGFASSASARATERRPNLRFHAVDIVSLRRRAPGRKDDLRHQRGGQRDQ